VCAQPVLRSDQVSFITLGSTKAADICDGVFVVIAAACLALQRLGHHNSTGATVCVEAILVIIGPHFCHCQVQSVHGHSKHLRREHALLPGNLDSACLQ